MASMIFDENHLPSTISITEQKSKSSAFEKKKNVQPPKRKALAALSMSEINVRNKNETNQMKSFKPKVVQIEKVAPPVDEMICSTKSLLSDDPWEEAVRNRTTLPSFRTETGEKVPIMILMY